MELVEYNRLVEISRSEVGSARGSEGHSQRLGEWVELHRQQGGVVVSMWSEWDLHSGDRQGIPVTRVHNCERSLPVGAAHLRRITPGCCGVETTQNAMLIVFNCRKTTYQIPNLRILLWKYVGDTKLQIKKCQAFITTSKMSSAQLSKPKNGNQLE